MPKKTLDRKEKIEEKLDYLGLDLGKIPEDIKDFRPLEYRVPKLYDDKRYRQYRYIELKDIQILLSPTTRLDEMEEKYKKASPLADYLDSEKEENILKYTTFLNMIKEFEISEVEKISEEQINLSKKIPFQVKYEGNYLWQIYYSENTDQYFMLVPIEDSDYSTFFYLLKKQLENRKTGKIFVPIKNVGYSNTYLSKSQFEDLENYLWLFTKDWPSIYEVYDKNEELSIHIVGETSIYGKIKSPYKIKLENKEEATQFYKLLKAMFILQTELPHHFEFKTDIGKNADIEFYVEDRKIEYAQITDWIYDEYSVGEDKIKVAEELIEENKEKLEKMKLKAVEQEIEYLTKEKQITTFLECKKSFFGKFKYYFKYNKKKGTNKIREKQEDRIEEKQEKNKKEIKSKKTKKEKYTIEELLELYKGLEIQETELKNILMDINALKLKNKNMKKKIENATLFIEEIDNHKKSIFEFWKFSNKDEIASLPEGEEEEINIIKKITKVFDYEEDLEKFGKTMDKAQRKNLSKEETDSIFLTTTNILEILNRVKLNEALPKDIEASLKNLKKEAIEEKTLIEGEDFDIFGGIVKDTTKVSQIKNKKHRELEKDKFNILDISKNTKQIGYKLSLEKVIENIKEALTKIALTEALPVYKMIFGDTLDEKMINVFNMNPEEEVKSIIKEAKGKINFYKINLKEGINAISYTNCIFYDNQNKTLPIGQDLSTQILVDISKVKLKINNKMSFKIACIEDEKDDFSKVNIKTVNVYEYDMD